MGTMRLTTLLLLASATLLSEGSDPSRVHEQPGSVALPSLDIATRARAFKPGEVVLLTVKSSQPLVNLQATAFGATFAGWASRPEAWHALVAVPVDTTPGVSEVTMRVANAAGAETTQRLMLKISPATFATRRLALAPRFVDPPASATKRIAAEGERIRLLYAKPLPARVWSGPFQSPVPGPATSSFGRLSILNGKSRGRHLGADFRADENTHVRAPAAGVVVLAADHYFAGNTVVIDHGGGLFSSFAHLSTMAVKGAASVAPGEILGTAGATGRVTGPHLHWSVRLHGTSVDPLSLRYAVANLPD